MKKRKINQNNQELTQMLEVTHKDIKKALINVFHMFNNKGMTWKT